MWRLCRVPQRLNLTIRKVSLALQEHPEPHTDRDWQVARNGEASPGRGPSPDSDSATLLRRVAAPRGYSHARQRDGVGRSNRALEVTL
jgi:hypothetical protein